MSEPNERPGELLNEGDLGEILLGAATTGELMADRLEARQQKNPPPTKKPGGRPPGKAAQFDAAVGKRAMKLLRRFSPFEVLLTGIEAGSLVSPKVRKEAAESVQKMAHEQPGERFLKGFADPVKTGYGITSALAGLFGDHFDNVEAERRIQAEILRRKREKAAAAANKAGQPFLDPSRNAPLPTARVAGPTPEMMRILQDEVQKRERAARNPLK
jgi:hypothetical protein